MRRKIRKAKIGEGWKREGKQEKESKGEKRKGKKMREYDLSSDSL